MDEPDLPISESGDLWDPGLGVEETALPFRSRPWTSERAARDQAGAKGMAGIAMGGLVVAVGLLLAAYLLAFYLLAALSLLALLPLREGERKARAQALWKRAFGRGAFHYLREAGGKRR